MTPVADVLREFEGSVQRAIGGYSAPGAERDDLFQQVALALVQALPRFRNQCSMKTYVLRIAHNCGMTFVRRRRKLLLTDVEPHETGATAEDLAIDAQQRKHLLRAIHRLGIGSRQVLMLSLEELTHREIGAVLGISQNAVAVRLHRARRALQDQLSRRDGEHK